MIALLLATVSVLLANRYKYGFLIGSFCVCLSLSSLYICNHHTLHFANIR